jgi:BlaI family penicillinase repressor
MGRKNATELSQSEWMVMQAIWDRAGEEPEVTVSEILPLIAPQRAWAFSTLKTTMDRLVKKGVLSSRIRGKTAFYRPEITRDAATRGSLGGILDIVLNGAFGPLVAYLAERKGLSRKQIAELEQMLEDKKKGEKP